MIASPLLHCPNLGPLESDGVKLQNSLLVDPEVQNIVLMDAACNSALDFAFCQLKSRYHHLWQ